MSAVALQLGAAAASQAGQSTADRQRQLRGACNELVGMVMFAQMLRTARNGRLNGELFHSSGEQIFQSQLDDVLIQKTCRDDAGGIFGQLGEAIYRRLGGPGTAGQTAQRVGYGRK
ncbi:MAG: hypothetical protein HQ546_02255 [Planctomycetes bacterium]|nr:hypothetical protein [Planctomycetota bacterium]